MPEERPTPAATTGTGRAPFAPSRVTVAVFAALFLGTLATFAPLRHAEFLNYDDDIYVTNNPVVKIGLSWGGLAWAWKTAAFNWHPLTWLSHMLDVQFFGFNAGAHHLVSVCLHAGNAVLLLYVLLRLGAALWPSALVAALFAVHPLRVEPVAWIAARKDLLSTLFWFAAILAYARYVERPTKRRYALVAAGMLFSLLCKGMVVTLPVLLLLLDYWPLRRWPGTAPAIAATRDERPLWWLAVEKLPLGLLAVAGMAVQIIAQRMVGGLRTFDEVPVVLRLANVPIAYASYVWMMVWPANLAIPYPLHPQLPPAWKIGGALLWLVATSALVARYGPRRPYLITGWLWYLVTLLPVIGFITIGAQSMADRYTYVSMIGLFVIVAWGLAEAAPARSPRRYAVTAAAAAALLACVAVSRHQIGYWQDTLALFRHTLDVTTDNTIAEINCGSAADTKGLRQEALTHYRNALRITPESSGAHFGLAIVLMSEGALAEAEHHLRELLRISPNFAGGQMRLAMVRLQQGDTAEARTLYSAVAEQEPTNALARLRLGQVAETEHRLDEAIDHYRRALQLDPTIEGGQYRLARALRLAGRSGEAILEYREALRLKPNDSDAENDLGALLQAGGQVDEAREHFTAALRLNPNDPEAHNNLGALLFESGQATEAVAHLQEALRIRPEYAGAHLNLGIVRLQQGQLAEARAHLRTASELDPDNPTPHVFLAQVAERERRMADAAAEYREALRLNPGDEQARGALDRLQNKRR